MSKRGISGNRSELSRALAILCCLSAALLIGPGSSSASTDIRRLSEQYVEQFYPLWFTYYQSQYVGDNELAGPNRITSLYQIVVAINVDTVYVSCFLNMTLEPVILTIPSTTTTYSILNLDTYGDIFDPGIPQQTAGTYGLVPPGFNGVLPNGVTPIQMPLDYTVLILRIDRFSPSGQDQTTEADDFRAALLLQTLSGYIANPSGRRSVHRARSVHRCAVQDSGGQAPADRSG